MASILLFCTRDIKLTGHRMYSLKLVGRSCSPVGRACRLDETVQSDILTYDADRGEKVTDK